MEKNTDGLSANRICDLTGVRPQTRAVWVGRGLLRSADSYGELDVIEQAVVKELLAALSKSHVSMVWAEVRAHLRGALVGPDTVVVWDPQARQTHITSEHDALRDAVCHGRPVHVLPLGAFVAEARRVYRVELDARRAAAAAAASAGTKSTRPKTRRGRR